jgi:hypothetical protein
MRLGRSRLGRRAIALTVAAATSPSIARADEPAGHAPADLEPDTVEQIAIEAQNPISSQLFAVALQYAIAFNAGSYGRTTHVLDVVPLVPIALGGGWGIFSRTVVPIAWQPWFESSSGGTFGLGDSTETLLLTHQFGDGPVLALGATGYFPTATDSALGTGNWALGPSAIAVVQPNPWTFGVAAGHLFSLYDPAGRTPVQATTAAIQVSLNLPDGWFINASPIGTTLNWSAGPARDRWLVPVGGAGGKVLQIGPQFVSLQVGAAWNAIRPVDDPTATWQVSAQVELLFPKDSGRAEGLVDGRAQVARKEGLAQ